MSKATIGDVAKAAGVSKKTVSRVLNNEPGVRKTTQDAVNAAIKSLDYVPNLNARRLRTNQSYLIGVLYIDYPSNFYGSLILNGAIKACDKLGYDLLIRPFESGYDAQMISAALKHMVERSNVDGFIVVPPLCEDESVIQALEETETPIVKIASLNQDSHISIHSDEKAGAQLAIEHLVNLGHSKIGFLNYLVGHAAGKWRYEGYKEALEKHGIEENANHVCQFRYGETTLEQACRKMLSQDDRPTAIFTANDASAAVVYRIASQLKLRIPYDLSVVGFDDDPAAMNLWPPLTTVSQPVAELGYNAATILIEQCIRHKAKTALPLSLPELVIRNSTGPLPE